MQCEDNYLRSVSRDACGPMIADCAYIASYDTSLCEFCELGFDHNQDWTACQTSIVNCLGFDMNWTESRM